MANPLRVYLEDVLLLFSCFRNRSSSGLEELLLEEGRYNSEEPVWFSDEESDHEDSIDWCDHVHWHEEPIVLRGFVGMAREIISVCLRIFD